MTERIKPPRALFVPFMMGSHFGVPFHSALQREIILTALHRVEKAEKSGDVYHFPKTWAEARKEGKEIEASRYANE